MKPTENLGSFLAHAVVLEDEAAQRYDELAEAMRQHNNPEVTDLFERMAGYSRLHRAEATDLAERYAGGLPALKPWEFNWPGMESPESASMEGSHYLMTAHHALKLALGAERSAQAFYAGVAAAATTDRIRELATEFAEEEADHARQLIDWLERVPPPDPGWDEDLDPPVEVE
ncbi:MAG: rubrerythrin [Wenzhouxiangella sp.]|nr:MAG: rubrerythrin [Wenzhouxiangella sp.]